MQNEKFANAKSFTITAIAASVGLGNVMRFPGLCAKYGGGAFILVYAVALVLMGIPLLNAEIALGRRSGGAAPHTFKMLNDRAEHIGWASAANSLVVAVFYGAVLGWILYMIFGIYPLCVSGAPQGDIGGYFISDVMGGEGYSITKLCLPVAACAVFGWIVMYFCIRGGTSALSRISRFTVPIPVAMLAAMAVKGICSGGAGALVDLFKPDFSMLAYADMWLAALGQVFFSLSVLIGVMPAYGSFLPKEANIFKCSLGIASADFGVSVLSAAVLFTTARACGIADFVASSGIATAFSVYPIAIARMFKNPVVCGIFGVVFYVSLSLVAVQSTLSLLEAFIVPVRDLLKTEHKRAALFVFLPAALLSLLYCTDAGVALVGVTDGFANGFNILLLGVAECIALGISGDFREICGEINHGCGRLRMPYAPFMLSLKFLCPAVLAALILFGGLAGQGAPLKTELLFGWSATAVIVCAGFAAKAAASARLKRK